MGLPQLQLVVVDDGTPEGERPNFNRLKRELEPLGHIFCSQPNAGAGAARNRAVSFARHDVLLHFDADNVPFPDMVERLWQAMSYARADSIAAPYIGVPPLVRRPTQEDAIFRYQAQGGPVALALLENVVGDTCSIMRRELFQALGGFLEARTCLEDWDFFFRVVAAGYRHFVYPDPLFYYTRDMNGRNLTQIEEYDNRSSLLARLESMPASTTAHAAAAFALEYIVNRRHN
jgi:cellulose synthase/poly-beta-1,6-N-acetylglucosamine synthase-like glycosyltransferase